jgi:hypothetical protein
MKTTDFASGFVGAGGAYPDEWREDARALLHGQHPCGRDLSYLTVIDDESEVEYNAENTTCAVLDVACDDGIVRVGLYADGAQTVLDVLDPDERMEDWAANWDADGVVPEYLLRHCVATLDDAVDRWSGDRQAISDYVADHQDNLAHLCHDTDDLEEYPVVRCMTPAGEMTALLSRKGCYHTHPRVEGTFDDDPDLHMLFADYGLQWSDFRG